MTVARLAPGKPVADAVAWLSGGRRGPSPGEPVAGMQLLPPGQSGWLVFELEPGEYWVNDIPGGGPLTAPVGRFTVLASAAPAQVPGALPRTGDAPSSLPGPLAVGTVLVALGLALRRRLGRGPGTGARSAR